jgi:hypothetical protein
MESEPTEEQTVVTDGLYRFRLIPSVRDSRGQTSGYLLEPVTVEVSNVLEFLDVVAQQHLKREVSFLPLVRRFVHTAPVEDFPPTCTSLDSTHSCLVINCNSECRRHWQVRSDVPTLKKDN